MTTAPLHDVTSRLERRELRYLLSLVLLDAGRPLAVADLVEVLGRHGYELGGRPSKVVSDALRWEVHKGRVVRVGRARYHTGTIPRSTVWWLRAHLRSRQVV